MKKLKDNRESHATVLKTCLDWILRKTTTSIFSFFFTLASLLPEQNVLLRAVAAHPDPRGVRLFAGSSFVPVRRTTVSVGVPR